MSGQYNDPVRVVAFNTLEHWSEVVSEHIAFEIQTRCDIDGAPVPEHIRDFVASYAGPVRQLALRLVRGVVMGSPVLRSSCGILEAGAEPMTQYVYNIVKAPLGWSIFFDGVKIGGIYGSKEAALEAATVAATFAIRDGTGVQINVPSTSEPDEIPGSWISAIRARPPGAPK
jgi:hypothetical protein